MKISRETLQNEAQNTGFRTEILEKVFQLLNLLENLQRHPFLKERLVLKGGTALNLFLFDLPRLSVDIDLNYIGAVDRETMVEERPNVEKAVHAVCSREGFSISRQPADHAGGKWRLRYDSSIGEGGNLEIDLNYMFRVPLWPISTGNSRRIGSFDAKEIPLVDIHELAAGKLAALLSRQAGRDLFDVHRLLGLMELDRQRLRLAFVLYGAMNRKDWRTVSVEDVNVDPRELRKQLAPLLRNSVLEELGGFDEFASKLVDECRQRLDVVLPFSEKEKEFLDRLLDDGKIEPLLLTRDEKMAERISLHPLLQWKALNVREYNG